MLCHLAGLGSNPACAPTAAQALAAAASLLAHPYPTVRRAASEALCVRLVLGVPAVGEGADVDAAAEVLASVAWDGPADGAREGRAAVCGALGVEAPPEDESKENEDGQPGPAAKAAASSGYQALVDAVERGTA